ncbi:uncharacterized protein LOC119385922 [Rhipicephalus sanguineus]|uniref:uncharacterized protein LOC119385922 n=1 Tax=Rhipicephalus sanguineus TaxID=34632 RepID=UPI001893A0BB|nr:uncharacterized protein LOC119385922 [Rhipicephalus sanguineus]
MASPPARAHLRRCPSILQWNVNSLRGRRDDFSLHLQREGFDVLALQEVYDQAEEIKKDGGRRARTSSSRAVAGVAAAHYNVCSVGPPPFGARAKTRGCCGRNSGSRRQLTSRREVHIDRGRHVTPGVCTGVHVCRQPGPHDDGLQFRPGVRTRRLGSWCAAWPGRPARMLAPLACGLPCTWHEDRARIQFSRLYKPPSAQRGTATQKRGR